jgi:prephenate dehydrogenase
MKTVTIVGAGLIGGSFGLALRKAGYEGRILGVSSPTALAAAVERGAVDEGAGLEEAVRAADLVFLSQAIGRILDTLRHLDAWVRPGALVTDAGSTKTEIVDAGRQQIGRCQFLGGHPMAGKETRGAGAADADLFRGRPWVLTPDEWSELETPAAREFVGWIERIGARPVVLDSETHDRAVSLSSHLPQLASTALAATVAARSGATNVLDVAGPGLADMTRLALSSYDLWRDILATNSANIDAALSAYIQELEHLRENLRSRQMQEEFERGARLAERVRGRRP